MIVYLTGVKEFVLGDVNNVEVVLRLSLLSALSFSAFSAFSSFIETREDN